MSKNSKHGILVERQFGPRASDYFNSAVHASGPDLAALIDLPRGHAQAHVLDLGCGGGHVALNVATHVRSLIAYDLSPEMLAIVESKARERRLENVTTSQGLAEHLPFGDGCFDIVLSRYSAHHWHDFAAGLREAARVLKPGGIARFVDTVAPANPMLDTFFQAIELLRDPSHVRNYAESEWKSALALAGLRYERTQSFRVRLDFVSWVARMATPAVQVEAIRALQKAVSPEVAAYFETASDGSFSIDVALFETRKPA